MIVGEHCKESDIVVNVYRKRKLTNIRAAGSDKSVILSPPPTHVHRGGTRVHR